MSSALYQSPLSSTTSVLPGWFSLTAPVFGARSEVGRDAAGLVNESISRRLSPDDLLPVMHPESRTPVGLAVVRPGGIAVKMQGKTSVFNPSGKGDRGYITGRSRRSRRRLMDKLSRVDMRPLAAERRNAKQARAMFVTLTYPQEFPSWQRAKRDLETLRKRMDRAYPFEWACWVEEFQARGAVHFHLVMVWRGPVNVKSFRTWLSAAWFEVVGSGDQRHLRAGTQAVPVHLCDGVGSLMSYLAGELGKVKQTRPADSQTGELIDTGRTWGFWHEVRCPYVTIAVVALMSWSAWDCLRDRVGEVFARSSYLRGVPYYREWRGALLYGDGLELLGCLFEGVEIDFRSLGPL